VADADIRLSDVLGRIVSAAGRCLANLLVHEIAQIRRQSMKHLEIPALTAPEPGCGSISARTAMVAPGPGAFRARLATSALPAPARQDAQLSRRRPRYGSHRLCRAGAGRPLRHRPSRKTASALRQDFRVPRHGKSLAGDVHFRAQGHIPLVLAFNDRGQPAMHTISPCPIVRTFRPREKHSSSECSSSRQAIRKLSVETNIACRADATLGTLSWSMKPLISRNFAMKPAF